LCFSSKVITFATQARGSKQYELTDHLGNIRTVVPDIKDPLSLPQNQNFRLPTLTLNNYYPYGMLQAGRTRNAGGYRFGYQGQDNAQKSIRKLNFNIAGDPIRDTYTILMGSNIYNKFLKNETK
jgi:hypothetical protein